MADSFARSLTDLAVKNAKPQATPYKLTDGGGLFLLIKPTGSKLWRYKFRIDGREQLFAIGTYPDVPLAEARRAHSDARKMVALGASPVQRRRDDKAAAERDRRLLAAGSFKAIADTWTEVTKTKLAPSSVAQRKREIDKNVLPAFGVRQISSITRKDIHEFLRKIDARAPEVARNVRSYLNGMFEYAIDAGLIDANPVPTNKILQRRSQTSHAALPEKRLSAFLTALDSSRINVQTKIAMKLVLLTACRKSEIVRGQWEEIDLDAAEWLIPAARMKARRPHLVPLSKQAVALLRELRKLTTGDLLFPHRDRPDEPMAERTLNAVLERIGFNEETKVHGFRSLFSTHFNEAGGNPDVIERVLAHAPANKVRAAYNRHEYRDERRAMLQAWADLIDTQRSGTRMTKRRKSGP